MFGLIPPQLQPPKLSLLYKCQDCDKKFELLSGFITKKCPHCNSDAVKVSVGFTERKRNPLDDVICW